VAIHATGLRSYLMRTHSVEHCAVIVASRKFREVTMQVSGLEGGEAVFLYIQ
jgi:hypothetical protein